MVQLPGNERPAIRPLQVCPASRVKGAVCRALSSNMPLLSAFSKGGFRKERRFTQKKRHFDGLNAASVSIYVD
jgi:hypothetical protein